MRACTRWTKASTETMSEPELVTICAWCPGASELTIQATDAGKRVSHGMCPACETAYRRELDAIMPSNGSIRGSTASRIDAAGVDNPGAV